MQRTDLYRTNVHSCPKLLRHETLCHPTGLRHEGLGAYNMNEDCCADENCRDRCNSDTRLPSHRTPLLFSLKIPYHRSGISTPLGAPSYLLISAS